MCSIASWMCFLVRNIVLYKFKICVAFFTWQFILGSLRKNHSLAHTFTHAHTERKPTYTVDWEIFKTLLRRDFSFGRPHCILIQFSHINTRVVASFVLLRFFVHWFSIWSLFHICASHIHTPYWDTWCHVQLLIFITQNSRNSSNSKTPYA